MAQDGYLPFPKGFATKAVHFPRDPDQWASMALIPPIVLSTTFKQATPGSFERYEYARMGNPCRDILESLLASLEDAKHGICFSSGLGASNVVLSVLKQGDHLITGDDGYGGTRRLVKDVASTMGCALSFVDISDPSKIEAAITPNTKLLWLESPTNPTLQVTDIRAVSKICKKHGIIFAIDNTFMTPYLQRPLDLGADVSVYSLTKYMNGHADVLMGAIVTNNDKLHSKFRYIQNALGCVPSPFDCSMVTRGLKTLPLRMRQHSKSSLIVAEFLEKHPKIQKVSHPGLKSHPRHELSKKQSSGHSGMISVHVKGTMKEAQIFLSNLKVFTVAGSLGNCESLAELPCCTSHSQLSPEERKRLDITENLIRLSIGIEDPDDLIEDLKQALDLI